MQNLIADTVLMSPLLSDSTFEMADSTLPSSDPYSSSPPQLLPFDFAPLNASPASSNTFESDLPGSANFSIDSNSLIDGAIPIGDHTALPTLAALSVETLNPGSGNTIDSNPTPSASEPATPSNAASTTPADFVNSKGANTANPTISSPATTKSTFSELYSLLALGVRRQSGCTNAGASVSMAASESSLPGRHRPWKYRVFPPFCPPRSAR